MIIESILMKNAACKTRLTHAGTVSSMLTVTAVAPSKIAATGAMNKMKANNLSPYVLLPGFKFLI